MVPRLNGLPPPMHIFTSKHSERSDNFGLGPQMRPIAPKHQRDGNHHCGQTSDQGAGPLDPKILKHLLGEKRKPGSNSRSQNDIGCNGRCSTVVSVSQELGDIAWSRSSECHSQRQIRINQVVETGQKDTKNAEADQDARSGR